MGEIRKDNLHESLIEELNELANIDLSGKKDKKDESLLTESKDVIGAINELFQSANNGKELIASAIGEPLSKDDTFSAMSSDINSLLATFKTNMMNNGITVESSDRFKSLIDKIATMVEEGSGKGVQFVTGKYNGNYETRLSSITISTNANFVPTYVFCEVNIYKYDSYTQESISGIMSNLCSITARANGSLGITMTDITADSFTLNWSNPNPGSYNYTALSVGNWYVIGVGEEDITLRNSLASILTEEGVNVTEEDDMASLIIKVDEEFNEKNNEMSSLNTNITLLTNQVNSLTSELAGKVNPAGTAVAGDVLSGKTFINSTGQTVTGTMVNRGGAQTVTPGTSNKTLNAGYYSGNITIAGDADLVAGNIKSGVNIFGVTGTAPVPSGTATAAQVLSGYTFSNGSSTGISGTMVNRGGAQTITPGTSNKTLNAGYYSGNITVAGDADLVAANIVSGKNIFGVTGTASTLKSSSNFNYAFFTSYDTTIYINGGASDTQTGQNYLITSFTNNAGDCTLRISGLTVHVSQYYDLAYTVEFVRNGSVVYTSTTEEVGSTKFSKDYTGFKKGDVFKFYIKSLSNSAKKAGVKDLMVLGSLSV